MNTQLSRTGRLIKSTIIIFFMCSILFPYASKAQTWEPDFKLTASGIAYSSDIATCFNNVHVTWIGYHDGYPEIYYKRSLDNGQTWEPHVRLSYSDSLSIDPSIAVSGDIIHVVWRDHRNGNEEIYYIRSMDNGNNWSSENQLTYSGISAINPDISTVEDSVHIVWQDYRDGNFEIYYKHSTNKGFNWSPGMRLTYDTVSAFNPVVNCHGSLVHVLWENFYNSSAEIYYKRSLDNGENWSPDNQLTYSGVGAYIPDIYPVDDTVHFLWEDYRDGNFEIYYKRSLDNGETWGSGTRLTDDPAFSGLPSIVASGNNVHVVWGDERDGNSEIYYKRSLDNGETWEDDIRLTYDDSLSKDPSIALSGDIVHVVWEDNREGYTKIFYKRGTIDAGIEDEDLHELINTYLFTTINLNNANIIYKIKERTLVNLSIYDLTGNRVRTLVNTTCKPGSYIVNWNGCSDNGKRVPNGIYFCHLQAGTIQASEKLFLLK